jgi:hypothetical protein
MLFAERARPAWSINLSGRQNLIRSPPDLIDYIVYQQAKFDLSGAAITKKISEDFHLKLHKRTAERILILYGPLDL